MSLGDIVRAEGAAILNFGKHPLTQQDLDTLDRLTDFKSQKEHYKHITTGDRGDKHDLWKMRIRDDPGEIEDYIPDIARAIEPIIGSEKMFAGIYRQVDPWASTFRRIQVNLLKQAGFAGHHVDRCSNPQWLMACVLQLSEQYEGGEYVIVSPNGEQRFKSPYGSLLIARTDVDHCIEPVTSGIRKTLVYFVGMDSKPNPNQSVLVEPS